MKSYKGWEIRAVGYHVEGYKKGKIIKARNKYELLKKIHEAEKKPTDDQQSVKCCICGKRRKKDADLYFSVPSFGRNAHICPACYKKEYLGGGK